MPASHCKPASCCKPTLRPAGPPPAVFTSDHALKLEWVPNWVAIIGSGYIGLEFSDVYTALGSEVRAAACTGAGGLGAATAQSWSDFMLWARMPASPARSWPTAPRLDSDRLLLELLVLPTPSPEPPCSRSRQQPCLLLTRLLRR